MSQPKIYDIAGAAGVSLATVSRVLNHPEKVKKETRDRVLRIIKEKGYKPNANARGLASRRSTTVAIVVPKLTRASVAEMIQGVSDSAQKYGYTIRLFVNDDHSRARDFWAEVIASSVDGILFLNDEMTPEVYELVRETPVPVLFINSVAKNNSFGSVGIDYQGCAYKTTEEMIRRGSKDIIFVSNERVYSVNLLMERGYQAAMEANGLEPKIIYSSGNLSLNEKFFNEYLSNHVPEVALLVRDSMAISFLNVATKKGIKVPEQLQVIGFQNTRYALLSNPKLTCVEIPIYEIGNRAMETLTKLMKDGETVDSEEPHLLVDYSIVWRETTR